MRHKTTRVISNSQVQPEAADTPIYATVKNGKYTLLDVQDKPCPTLTPEAQAILDKERRVSRLKRLCQELMNADDNVLGGGLDLLDCLDKAQAAFDRHGRGHDAESRWAFQEAAIDLFFLLDVFDRLPIDKA